MQSSVKVMPNIVIWSWMRTILNLSGTELFIFAYMFSQTFDSLHRCFATLADMEYWFGVSRQTITRNIDRLVASGLLTKDTTCETGGFIKHNSYSVRIDTISERCECAGFEEYSNFIASYRSLLVTRFPNDVSQINECMDSLIQWHKSKNIEVRITLNDIAKILCCDENETCSLNDLIDILKSDTKAGGNRKSFISNSVLDFGKTKAPKPKRNTKRHEKEMLIDEFVSMYAHGDDTLRDILLKFLETSSGKSFSADQFRQQLNNLYSGCSGNVEKMIDSVNNSYMNNYRALYYHDKSEVDMQLKENAIVEYIKEFGDIDGKLEMYLNLYIHETPKGKSYTVGQFNLALKSLSALCKTLESKIRSVEKSYANSYASLAYESTSYSDFNSCDEIEIPEKMSIIDKFIADGSYYLTDGLRESLVEYVKETSSGKSMSASMFTMALQNLRLYCLDDSDKVSHVRLAIQNNSKRFASEDFDETRRLKSKLQSRQQVADNMDRVRKQNVMKAKMKNPSDPRLVGVEQVFSPSRFA